MSCSACSMSFRQCSLRSRYCTAVHWRRQKFDHQSLDRQGEWYCRSLDSHWIRPDRRRCLLCPQDRTFLHSCLHRGKFHLCRCLIPCPTHIQSLYHYLYRCPFLCRSRQSLQRRTRRSSPSLSPRLNPNLIHSRQSRYQNHSCQYREEPELQSQFGLDRSLWSEALDFQKDRCHVHSEERTLWLDRSKVLDKQ